MFDLQATKTWSVLAVDDEPDNLSVVRLALEFFGVTTRTERNGLAGLVALQQFTPDFILLDLSMPTMDGWEMCTRVKSDPRWQNVPVIALTAHALPSDEARGMAHGFDGYIIKPIRISQLVPKMRQVMEAKRRLEHVAM